MAARKPRPFITCAMCPKPTKFKVQAKKGWRKRICSSECQAAQTALHSTAPCPGGCGTMMLPWIAANIAEGIAGGTRVGCHTCNERVRGCPGCIGRGVQFSGPIFFGDDGRLQALLFCGACFYRPENELGEDISNGAVWGEVFRATCPECAAPAGERCTGDGRAVPVHAGRYAIGSANATPRPPSPLLSLAVGLAAACEKQEEPLAQTLARVHELGALIESMICDADRMPLHVDQVAHDVARAVRSAFPDRADSLLSCVTVRVVERVTRDLPAVA